MTTGIVGAGIAPARTLAEVVSTVNAGPLRSGDDHIRDYLVKMRSFNMPHEDDVYLDRQGVRLLKSSVRRFKRIERTVGHGNFQLLGFDDAVKVARAYSRVGRFAKEELDFLEMLFYRDPGLYGFFGEKPVKNLTDRIRTRDVVKISGTGNYLYKGRPLETYRKIKRDIGRQVVLTSGVRSVIKQFLLFLNKAHNNGGNLSLASRSLAPPGYSYHGISDFDVGQAGFGAANFTANFMSSEVYKRLCEKGYLALRYPKDNLLGVRFEPWHVKAALGI